MLGFHVLQFRLAGQVVEFSRIGLQVVEFEDGPGAREIGFLMGRAESTGLMSGNNLLPPRSRAESTGEYSIHGVQL